MNVTQCSARSERFHAGEFCTYFPLCLFRFSLSVSSVWEAKFSVSYFSYSKFSIKKSYVNSSPFIIPMSYLTSIASPFIITNFNIVVSFYLNFCNIIIHFLSSLLSSPLLNSFPKPSCSLSNIIFFLLYPHITLAFLSCSDTTYFDLILKD